LGKEKTNDETNFPIALTTSRWNAIYRFLKLEQRNVYYERKTNETDIKLQLNLDGNGKSKIDTGISFFDHMIDQLARHGGIDIELSVKGDLEVDEHHTIEDTAIALGESFAKALGNKLGIERYGFCLPMDDCLAQVAIDFGGRNWLVWETEFNREMIGKMPTEMFIHFFKSFSDGAKANINIKAEGANEHHKIEAIFKAFAKAIKVAIKRDPDKMILPSTKGSL
jgi:imidazoleglycerol-phosphate dehydratase/histidinol-phosphatase